MRQWPDRAGLNDILNEESKKRIIAFKNLYGMTFLSRQRKVVRHQVDQLPRFRQLPLDDEQRVHLRYLCTNRVISLINRWPEDDSEFMDGWKKVFGSSHLIAHL
jgi:hypothetical protein